MPSRKASSRGTRVNYRECDDGGDLYLIDKMIFLAHDYESSKVLLNFLGGIFQYGYSSRPTLLNEDNQYLESIKNYVIIKINCKPFSIINTYDLHAYSDSNINTKSQMQFT